MIIIGPMLKTKRGNQFVVIMMDQYTGFMKAILTPKTNSTLVARIILEHWVGHFGISSKLFTDNGPQFVLKFFLAVCSTLEVKNITTTECHPENHSRMERFNSTIVSRLCHNVTVHQADWDTHLLPLTSVYNVQAQKSIKVCPFSLVLTRTAFGPATIVSKRL